MRSTPAASAPARAAVRDFLICLAVCAAVAITDLDALQNPLRLAILAAVLVGVPTVNLVMNLRRARTAN